jgi:hypothetical protein
MSRAIFILLLLAAPFAYAYDIIRHSSGAVVTWDNGTIPLQIKMDTSPVLSDGTNHASSVFEAIQAWNSQINRVQFSAQIVAAGPAINQNGINEIAFGDKLYDEEFDENVLAVAVSYTSVAARPDGTYRRTQSDVIFNSNWVWDSYRGPLRFEEDIRRVAIHELGHVLGLTHPDQNEQVVSAIMNSTVSFIDAIQSDDRDGAWYLYGSSVGMPPPANDLFSQATNITVTNGRAILQSSNRFGTAEAGEPAHAGTAASTSVWFQFTPPISGRITLSTGGSNFDTLLAVYTGSSVSALTPVASNDDQSETPHIRTSSLEVAQVEGGTTYRIAVDGWSSEFGAIQLVLDYFPNGTAPSITAHPSNRFAAVGQAAQFTVGVAGTPAPSTRWQRRASGSSTWVSLDADTATYTGTGTATLTVANITQSMSGDRFRCVASNSLGSVTSFEAALTIVSPPQIHSITPSQSVYEGTSFTFSSSVSGTGLSYQWEKDAQPISGAIGPSYSISNLQLSHQGSYRLVVTNAAGSVTSNPSTLTVLAATLPTITGIPATLTVNYGESISIFPSVSGGNPSPTFQWKKDDAVLTGQTSYYFIKHGVKTSDSGSYVLTATNAAGTISSSPVVVTVRPAIAPSVTSHPQSQTISKGGSTSFHVGVSGSATLTYQWFRNGTAIPGQTGSSLYISNVSLLDSGLYSVKVTNDAGTATSNNAELVVLPAQPPSMTSAGGVIYISESNRWLSIHVSVSGTNPISFQWYKNGKPVAGATSNHFSKSDMTEADAGIYTLVASNEAGLGVSGDYSVIWQNPSTTPWLDTYRLGNIQYFIATVPARIMRYNVVDEQWMPIVYLSETKVPTAFLPTDEGIFIAYNRELVRRSLDLTQETSVYTAVNPIQALFSHGPRIYFQEGETLRSFDRTSLAATSSAGAPSYSPGLTRPQRPVYSPLLDRFYTTTRGISPSDISSFTIGANGAVTSVVESPYHGDFAHGTRQYLSPDQDYLVDNSGVVYDINGLTYYGGLGARFDDLAFLSDGSMVALRGATLERHLPDRHIVTGSHSLPAKGFALTSTGNHVHVFGAPPNNTSNPAVTRVAAASFVNLRAGMDLIDAPTGQKYSIDYVFQGPDGVVYIISRSLRGIARWDPDSHTFLKTLPLLSLPAFVDYDREGAYLYLVYAEGVITRIDLTGDLIETEFARFPVHNYPMGFVAMDDDLLVHIHQAGVSADLLLTLGSQGEKKFLSGWSYHGRPYAWHSDLRRLYSQGRFDSTRIEYFTVPATGVVPGAVEGFVQNLPQNTTMRLSDDRNFVLLSNGKILNTDLQELGALPHPVSDGVWLSNGMFTVRPSPAGTQVQKWARISYAAGGSINLVGLPQRVLKISDTRMLVITLFEGYSAFFVLDDALNVVSSSTNGGSISNKIAYSTHTLPATSAPNSHVEFQYTVFNAGSKPWGENHYVVLRSMNYDILQMVPVGSVPVGGSKAINFSFVTPNSLGAHQMRVQGLENGVEWFGPESVLSQTLAGIPAPVNGISYTSVDGPSSLLIATSSSINYQVTNTGTKQWGSNHRLVLRDANYNILQTSDLGVLSTGGTVSGQLTFTAPSTPGTYQYRVQALENGVQWFGEERLLSIVVTSPPVPRNGISFGSTNFPSSIIVGNSINFQYHVTNSGTKDWGANHLLVLRDEDYNIIQMIPIGATAVNESRVTQFSTTPVSVGTKRYRLQALENGVQWFGPEQLLDVTVNPVPAPTNAIRFNSNTFPASANASATVEFAVSVTNIGTKAWGSNHRLVLRDQDYNIVDMKALGAGDPGFDSTVFFSFAAPVSAGTHRYRLQALENGVQWFGPEVALQLTVATPATPQNAITFASSLISLAVAPGEVVNLNASVTNSGTKIWAGNHFLVLRDGDYNTRATALLPDTLPQESATAHMSFSAPATPGIYSYRLQALENGVQWFGPE